MKQIVALLVVVLVGVSLLPVVHSENPAFADPRFQRVWAAQTSAAGAIDLWGREPLLWRVEPYADAPDGRRVVQYFDRGRMEMTRRPDGSTEVTQGLLALELTSGEISVGASITEHRAPPETPIDGGDPDPRVPTYAGLKLVTGEPAPNRSGRGWSARDWIDARGVVTAGHLPVDVRLARYVEETGHNLPDVTVELLQRPPFAGDGWIAVLGYPISEPFWSIYRRAGEPRPSLIQVFERRILVYTPSLAPDQRFTVANVGRHYYRWRYGAEAEARWAGPKAGAAARSITVVDGYEAGVFAEGLGAPVGLATGVRGELWVVTRQGDVYRVDSERPDGTAGQVTRFATGLANPRGIAVDGGAVYVAVDDGIVRPVDDDGDGVADRIAPVTSAVEPANGPRGAPALDQDGRLLVSGAILPGRGERVVARIDPGRPAEPIASDLRDAGPIAVSGTRLYTTDTQADGSTVVLSVPLDAAQPRADLRELKGTIGAGQSVTAILPSSDALWRSAHPHDLIVATESKSGGSLYTITPPSAGSPPEVVQFATGFEQPVALVFGFDGSLYVADAAARRVYKIVPATLPVASRL